MEHPVARDDHIGILEHHVERGLRRLRDRLGVFPDRVVPPPQDTTYE